MSPAPAISLPRFEGPLDLLLALIRKNEFDINDIPIAAITRQYMDYLNRAEAMDLDLGSDFVYLAATLIQIKSRCLLPVDPEVAAREPDPREELAGQLLSHEQVRNAAEFLHERFEVASSTWSRTASRKAADPDGFDGPDMTYPGTLNLFDVLQLARKALETARAHESLRLEEDGVTVEEMVAWLSRKLSEFPHPNPLPSEFLFREQRDLSRRIALFLAMLEMSRRGDFGLEQEAEFGPIYLSRCDMAHPCPNVE
jgi:segregation and condensation protein A